MLFNVMVHVEADDEVHVQEVVSGWTLTPGALIQNISSAYPLTVDPGDLPVVQEDGKVKNKNPKKEKDPEPEPEPEPTPEEPVDPGWTGGVAPDEPEPPPFDDKDKPPKDKP
jgi:hypothetical protein